MKYAAFALLVVLAGGAAQAQTVEYYEPYTAPLISVAAPSIYVPPLNIPSIKVPPLFVPSLQNGRGQQVNHPFRRGVGGPYVGYDTVGSGGIGYESPGAYPREGRDANRNRNRSDSTHGFNPGAGDPTFNPAGIKSTGFGHRR